MQMPRGGGSVVIPEPYNRKPSYPTYAQKYEITDRVLIAYRNWRSTMSGHPECEGMIAVGAHAEFPDLRDFMRTSRAGLSIQWSAADTVAGTSWTANEKKYPVEEREGANGPELVQLLAVHRVGLLDVYDDPALMYVVADRRGVHVAVWITSRQGGPRRALRLADRIAASFQR
jgi:hypothetical protein